MYLNIFIVFFVLSPEHGCQVIILGLNNSIPLP